MRSLFSRLEQHRIAELCFGEAAKHHLVEDLFIRDTSDTCVLNFRNWHFRRQLSRHRNEIKEMCYLETRKC